MKTRQEQNKILGRSLPVIVNVGLEHFAEAMREQGMDVISVRWRPPHMPSKEIKDILDQLL